MTHAIINVPPMHWLHQYTMNVPELKLPSSSSSVDSISTLEEEADKDKDGDEEGRNTGNSSKSKTNSSSMDDTEEEQQQEIPTKQQEKLTEHHAKNYFNSTMGGKDLHVLFAMAIGCHSRDILDHKEPPFSQSKVYHSEVKPDASTLNLKLPDVGRLTQSQEDNQDLRIGKLTSASNI